MMRLQVNYTNILSLNLFIYRFRSFNSADNRLRWIELNNLGQSSFVDAYLWSDPPEIERNIPSSDNRNTNKETVFFSAHGRGVSL